jgi:hypothetical protein
VARYLGRRLTDPAYNVSGECIREWPAGHRDWLVILQVTDTQQHSTLASRCVPAVARAGLRLVASYGERVG